MSLFLNWPNSQRPALKKQNEVKEKIISYKLNRLKEKKNHNKNLILLCSSVPPVKYGSFISFEASTSFLSSGSSNSR